MNTLANLPETVKVRTHKDGHYYSCDIVGGDLCIPFRNASTAQHWLQSRGYEQVRKGHGITGEYRRVRQAAWGIHWGRITICGAFVTCMKCGTSYELAVDRTHFGVLRQLQYDLDRSGYAFDERNGWRCFDCIQDEKEGQR